MFNDVIWFAGFIILHLMKNQINNVSSEELNCAVTDDKLYADCSDRKLKSIKHGLGEKLEILNISSNPFDKLNEDDLKEYVHLKELIMKYLNVSSVHVNFLMPLIELTVLDISGSSLETPPKFPPSITTLRANKVQYVTKYNFTNLKKLNEIHLNHNNLTTLPAFHIKAPIIKLYAYKNQITKLDLNYLANFCQLKHLGLENFTSGPEAADNCCYVKLWVEEHSIVSKLSCEKDCPKDKYPFNETSVNTYKECLKNNLSESFWDRTIVKIVVVVGIILAVVAILCFLYLCCGFSLADFLAVACVVLLSYFDS